MAYHLIERVAEFPVDARPTLYSSSALVCGFELLIDAVSANTSLSEEEHSPLVMAELSADFLLGLLGILGYRSIVVVSIEQLCKLLHRLEALAAFASEKVPNASTRHSVSEKQKASVSERYKRLCDKTTLLVCMRMEVVDQFDVASPIALKECVKFVLGSRTPLLALGVVAERDALFSLFEHTESRRAFESIEWRIRVRALLGFLIGLKCLASSAPTDLREEAVLVIRDWIIVLYTLWPCVMTGASSYGVVLLGLANYLALFLFTDQQEVASWDLNSVALVGEMLLSPACFLKGIDAAIADPAHMLAARPGCALCGDRALALFLHQLLGGALWNTRSSNNNLGSPSDLNEALRQSLSNLLDQTSTTPVAFDRRCPCVLTVGNRLRMSL